MRKQKAKTVTELIEALGVSRTQIYLLMSKYPCLKFTYDGLIMGYVRQFKAFLTVTKLGRPPQEEKHNPYFDREKFLQAMKMKNWTMEQFCRQAGLSHARYRTLLDGKAKPKGHEKAWFTAMIRGFK